MDMEEFGSSLEFVSVTMVGFVLVALVGEVDSKVVVKCKWEELGVV
jgi:hypothetical protein